MDHAFAAAQRQASSPGKTALAGKLGANRQGGSVVGGFRKTAVGDGGEALLRRPPSVLVGDLFEGGDNRGRQAVHVKREGQHHQVGRLELFEGQGSPLRAS